ncbi:hypothetical protein QQS21_002849 [Conoideocrella luteorostrata]|uniref:Heterokaryon incompatibility domain-containing protein n=1 Tax=Conoideocrella luteorostrata TaxID=1105319 RepID=A0AAJ0CX87_9HYPO|nr:hypothetical protein QQS21_002849 [Conoideocrella luteorostrata]
MNRSTMHLPDSSLSTLFRKHGQGISEPYASLPLGTSTGSIRLLKIEPELGTDELLVCQLERVSLGDLPEFDAVSYRWGDESIQKTIIVNGVRLPITKNLWDGMDYFRKHRKAKPLWIDAISIDQKNISEKNQQLLCMKRIYQQAKTVVVWLGAKYCSKQWFVRPLRECIKNIAKEEYWKRMWVVQEIGNATKVEVCLGDEAVDWDTLRKSVPRPHQQITPDSDPFSRLDFTKKDRCNGGCSLTWLLNFHRNAECKDPRDKIYGLIGLATDGHGFPMDYGKNLFEVWIDTIDFVNSHELLSNPPREPIEFYSLIRNLLGGAKLEEPTGVVRFRSGLDDGATGKRRIHRKSYQLGRIMAIGPTMSEIAASVTVDDEWQARMQNEYKGDHLQDAGREYRSLNCMVFRDLRHKLPKLCVLDKHGIKSQSHRGTPRQGHVDEGLTPFSGFTANEPRLAIVSNAFVSNFTPYKLALVPPGARTGNLIYHIEGCPMKKIVMPENRQIAESPGTAIMIRDITEKPRWDDIKKEAASCNTGRSLSTYNINIGPRMLYALLFGDEVGPLQPERSGLRRLVSEWSGRRT